MKISYDSDIDALYIRLIAKPPQALLPGNACTNWIRVFSTADSEGPPLAGVSTLLVRLWHLGIECS